MTNRLHYIDVYKGILLILVVIHHAPLVCSKFNNPYMDTYWINNIIIAFFMPAWFVATGYCSNFEKPFTQFLWKNFKGIMLPCFTLYCINHILQCINTFFFEDSSWMTISFWLNPGIRTFITEGGVYWFLSALFISKMTYWLVNKFICEKCHTIFFIILFVGGLFLYQTEIIHNYFFFQHAMMLSVFLLLGKEIKKYENLLSKYISMLSFTFFVMVLVLSFLEIGIPAITRDITVTPLSSMLFLLLSTLGSITALFFAKAISKSKILEYIGQGSIVMYAFNYVTLMFVANLTVSLFKPESMVTSIICFLCIIIISILLLIFYYWLLKKYIRVILGKF